jgi:hypothetical protein
MSRQDKLLGNRNTIRISKETKETRCRLEDTTQRKRQRRRGRREKHFGHGFSRMNTDGMARRDPIDLAFVDNDDLFAQRGIWSELWVR